MSLLVKSPRLCSVHTAAAVSTNLRLFALFFIFSFLLHISHLVSSLFFNCCGPVRYHIFDLHFRLDCITVSRRRRCLNNRMGKKGRGWGGGGSNWHFCCYVSVIGDVVVFNDDDVWSFPFFEERKKVSTRPCRVLRRPFLFLPPLTVNFDSSPLGRCNSCNNLFLKRRMRIAFDLSPLLRLVLLSVAPVVALQGFSTLGRLSLHTRVPCHEEAWVASLLRGQLFRILF